MWALGSDVREGQEHRYGHLEATPGLLSSVGCCCMLLMRPDSWPKQMGRVAFHLYRKMQWGSDSA